MENNNKTAKINEELTKTELNDTSLESVNGGVAYDNRWQFGNKVHGLKTDPNGNYLGNDSPLHVLPEQYKNGQ